jgi:hypothetical protein
MAALPLLLIMSFGYVLFTSRVVGKYARALEREVSTDTEDPGTQLTAPALSRLIGALYGGESTRLRPLRVFHVVLAGSVVSVAVFIEVVVLLRIEDPTVRVFAYLFYGAISLVCLMAYNRGHPTRRSRDCFRRQKLETITKRMALMIGRGLGSASWDSCCGRGLSR